MIREIEPTIVTQQGSYTYLQFRTISEVKLRRFIELGSEAERIQKWFYFRHKEVADRDYYDAIGKWLAKH
jgi:hypothetical protein